MATATKTAKNSDFISFRLMPLDAFVLTCDGFANTENGSLSISGRAVIKEYMNYNKEFVKVECFTLPAGIDGIKILLTNDDIRHFDYVGRPEVIAHLRGLLEGRDRIEREICAYVNADEYRIPNAEATDAT